MSPEQDEIRKSLDRIQSMLSQNPSPMTATSLADRIHRASLESGAGLARSPLPSSGDHGGGQQSHYREERGAMGEGRGRSLGSSNLNNHGGGQHQEGGRSTSTSSSVSFAAGGGLTSPLAPIEEPSDTNTHYHNHGHHRTSNDPPATLLSPQQFQNRDSLSAVLSSPPLGNTSGIISGRSSSSHGGGNGRDSLSYTPFAQIEETQQHQPLYRTDAAAAAAAISVIRSPSSAFSTVNKKLSLTSTSNSSAIASPPFGPASALGSATPKSVMSGALASESHWSPEQSITAASHFGLDTSSHPNARRETSLLVSPVSHHSSHHSRSPQSEARMSDAASVFGSGHDSPSGTGALDATPSAASARSDARSAQSGGRQHYGPTGTPLVTSSSARLSAKNSITPATAGLTIHTNLQPGNGRDPTPYHHRSNPSTSPYYNNNNSNSKESKVSDASSRSGRDPPAKSPFPTSIGGQNNNGTPHHSGTSHGYTTGYATNKSTPNVHSHHYHNKDHSNQHSQQKEYQQQLQFAEDQNELSMIEEDDSSSVADESLVSNVTSATFVRTPIVRKHHGHNNHTPRNNTTAAGHHSHHGAGVTHHTTPRSNIRTPGSTTSTTIHAHTPSTSQLLHRPSLAMRESLTHLATNTSHALEEIWDCVGVAPDERASQLDDLIQKISLLCETKVQEEEGLRDQFRKEISEARKEWEDICSALQLEGEEDPVSKMRRDPSSKDLGSGSGVSLQWEYEAMTGRLESLRAVKQSAMADMQLSQGKIYEAFAALHGCTVEEASQAMEMQPYLDVETNLTLDRREELRAKANEYEDSVSTRTKAVVTLLLDCQSMIRELEIVPSNNNTNEIPVGRSEDDVKIMNSLEPLVEERDGQHLRRGQSNNYTIVNRYESLTCIGIGNSAFDRLTSRIAELNGEKRRRRAELAEMGSSIAALWQMLRVPAEEQMAFTTSIRGLGLDTLQKGETEIARLQDLKSVMIGKLVREQRAMIEDLWDKTNSSAGERASFDAYFHIHDDEQLTGDILVKHEDYVASLKVKLDMMQPILDLIAKREAIIEDRIELEFLQKDPDRLKSRGAAKQLQKEEKMGRRVAKELPKITSILEKSLRQWYAKNKPVDAEEEGEMMDQDLGHFMYQGSPYLMTIQYQEEEWRTRKENSEHERHRKREEERSAASSANAAFGYTSYKKLPGKKWNPSTNADHTGAATNNAAGSSRPRSASTLRSGSNMRSGPAMRSGGSHPTGTSNNSTRSGSNMRLGGRGPLGDVSSSRQNTSRPPSRPRGGAAPGPGGAGVDRGKKVASGRGYRPASAPRMRL
eukprot:CAMPEP_0172331892 /NCGR_PEP_ID=MMETSP1058-20130122/62157_1 /TAXON_ID=83371 /ORGANISM="Detonula confervacea, Strain CCMP 353" /LENGTH=1307 /DNA_ID=CAMNT_0013049169 /DNA_START=63 /DNA_END=3986 /DNA_ORIENTATION=+